MVPSFASIPFSPVVRAQAMGSQTKSSGQAKPFGQSKPAEGVEGASSLGVAALWAKNYINSLRSREDALNLRQDISFSEATTPEGRIRTAGRLKTNLSLASAQAWSQTENLLSEELRRHGINADVIDPWAIAADSHNLFHLALQAYAERITPHRFAITASKPIGQMRKKYTANDPRAIGFVSMQFHYTGQILQSWLSSAERMLLEPYIKVMDDHLYMPLEAAYDAAARLPYSAPALKAVRHLLPISTRIAHRVCDRVCRENPQYETYNGLLKSPQVRTSSIRDVEMFQVYLCLCVLENNFKAVQDELFPLCVILYPKLNVRWSLVQSMISLLGWEMHDRLPPDSVAVFLPFLHILNEIFSVDLLG